MLSHSNSSNNIPNIDESSVIEIDSADASPPKIKRQKTWIPYRYRRRANLIPKIPPRDIRRELPSIHARVQNSFDPTFYFQYLNKFCVPDMVYKVTYMDYLPNGMFSKPFHGQTVGFEHLITGYIFFKERYPDLTFQVSNIKIHQQLFSRDIILFSDIFVSMTDPLYEQRSSDDIDILKNTFNGPKAENFEVLQSFLTKSSKKVSKGTMTIFVNELGQIYNMHLAVVNFQTSF